MEPYYSEFIKKMEEIRQKTIQEQGESTRTWEKLRDEWIAHYESIPMELIRQRENLLMAVRFTEAFQGLLWVQFLCSLGGYFPALRELRNMLESTVQAYYVDSEYLELDVGGKLAVLKEMTKCRNHYGGRLVEKAQPPHKGEIKVLYGVLSEYAHPSYDSIYEILSSHDSDDRIVELMQPGYDSDLFAKCKDLTEKVIRIIISLNQELINHLNQSG